MWSLLRIAVRNVARNRRRTGITLVALGVGVGVLVAVNGLMNGLQATIVDLIVDGQTGALQVHRKGYTQSVEGNPLGLSVPSDAAFLGRIRAAPGVTDASARIRFAGMINRGDETTFFSALAVDPAHEYAVCTREKDFVIAGSPLAPGGSKEATVASVVLNDELAKSIGAGPGDAGALLSNDRDGTLNAIDMSVVGTFDARMPGDKKVGLTTLASAQALLRMDGQATEIIVGVKRLEDAPRVARALRQALGPDYDVDTWETVASFAKDAIGQQNWMLGIVATVFMVVMLLGVVNTMLMAVLERTREIGTMMAVGVRRRSIVGLFLMEASTLGLLGGLLGAALGLAVVALMHHQGLNITAPGEKVVNVVRPAITVGQLLTAIAAATVGAGLASLYPAYRASRLRPVEALATV